MRTLWIIVGIYILWRIVKRFLAVRRFIKNAQNQNFQDPQPRKEGEVNIISRDREESDTNSNKGDYVDYEEV